MDPCAFDMLFAKNVPHILEKIFLSLDLKSYKACLKVNSTWHRILTSESFCKKAEADIRLHIKLELVFKRFETHYGGIESFFSKKEFHDICPTIDFCEDNADEMLASDCPMLSDGICTRCSGAKNT